MCPMVLLLPVVVTVTGLCIVNWLLRKRRVSPSGKAVFISGCDRGFGETLSCQLALDGYTVYSGCLDLHSDGANRLRQYGNVHIIHVDVTSDTSVQKAAEFITTRQREHGLWAVVNNAGIAVYAENEWCTMDAYERVLGVNLLGTIRVTKAMLPLVRRAQGRVVNISSLAGRCALPGFTAYSASKFGVIGFSDSLRREMWKFKVKVITIEPKLYRTAIADADFHSETNTRMWHNTPETVRLDYGDTYFAAFLETMLKNLRRSSRRTYMVIDDLLHAITAQNPYTRYVPGRLMQILADSFVIQSNFVQDNALHTQLTVQCVPFMMRKKSASIMNNND